MPPFRDFQKHCTACRQGQPCGLAHLYVIELDKSLWQAKKRFRVANPLYDEEGGLAMLYVGKTSNHVPRCRQSQHQRYDFGRWRCYCGSRDEENDYVVYELPSRFIRGHTKGHFRPELFLDWNPVAKDLAVEQEAELAKSLKERGFAVWAGHLESGLK